jgi:hypothetical protein
MNSITTSSNTAPMPNTLDVQDDMGNSITSAINSLSNDASMFTRWRLRSARNQEAIKLAESTLAETMAAKRRAFAYNVALCEDHVKKLMLSESMRKTEAVEREIAQTINNALMNFESLVTDREQEAYKVELQRISAAAELRDSGKLSEKRFSQMVESIEASTDKIVEGVHDVTREILANMRQRFHAALQQSGGAV